MRNCQHNTGTLCLRDGSVIAVDLCLAPLLQALNDAGLETNDSCCGHGRGLSHIGVVPTGNVRIGGYGCCGEPWTVSLEWPGHSQEPTGEGRLPRLGGCDDNRSSGGKSSSGEE